ncbi:MAG: SCO family protein [Crocinitomicaceae bacterium]|nr:SCO family protein [Crocinitomicaceae bacterium]
MVDPELLRVGYGHTVGDFTFLNQDGKTITSDEVKGKIHVAEYFFTTCKSICPKMNQQMQRIHSQFRRNDDLKILSFTVDPDVDTVDQMKWYANSHGADSKQWHFLTGDKEELYQLARRSYFVLKPAEAQNLGDAGSDFIHTNNFVLVDRKSRIRGYYDGTSEEEVSKLILDIKLLMEEGA